MDGVLRAAFVYFFILVILRISGRRTMGEMSAFDFILLLIIAEAVQQAVIGQDFSMFGAMVTVVTLIGMDIIFSLLRLRYPKVDLWASGSPTILLEDGMPIAERMRKARIGEDDILETARKTQGLERIDQIKYAILEKTGGISIIPKEN